MKTFLGIRIERQPQRAPRKTAKMRVEKFATARLSSPKLDGNQIQADASKIELGVSFGRIRMDFNKKKMRRVGLPGEYPI
jgi:hypothetical protein